MYLAKSVREGSTCNNGTNDNHVGVRVRATNVAELSVNEAVVIVTLLWKILLL